MEKNSFEQVVKGQTEQTEQSPPSCTSVTLSPMALDYCVPAPINMGFADMRDYVTSPTLSNYSYVDINYGEIKIVSKNEIADDKHHKLMYKYAHKDKYQDIFDVECLNKYLDECGDYVIAGLYGSKMAVLFTRYGSLIGSIRCSVCEKCRKKWEHSIAINVDYKCYDLTTQINKTRVMFVRKGQMRLPHDYVDIVQQLFAERSKNYVIHTVHKRSKSEIANDLLWSEVTFKFMESITNKYLDPNASNKTPIEYKKKMRDLVFENQTMMKQVQQLRTEYDLLLEKIRSSNEDIDLYKNQCVKSFAMINSLISQNEDLRKEKIKGKCCVFSK